jgi:MerR family transcriptional regulator, thiopeptide resistance regulator
MFTVKQLSKMAGVTPRTLHHYDDIGLLKPSRVGDNGYRYYGEESLLRLQQILFYRELNIPLEDIRKIMGRRDFDVLKALESHKQSLGKQMDRINLLLKTVDNTINHLKGKENMSQKALFEGFSDEQQAEYEKEVMQKYDPATVKASVKKWNSYSPQEKQRIGEEGNAVYKDILAAMPKGAASAEVQACIDRWRRHIEHFWVPNNEQLLGLINGYNDDPRFKANFDKIDPKLAGFMREAVQVYVEKGKK